MKIKFNKSRIHELSAPQKPPKVNIYNNKVSIGESRSRLSYLLYFFLIVFIFIFISLCCRLIFLYLKSTFNTPSYSIYIVSKTPFVISYDSELKRITEVRIQSFSKDRIIESIALGVPIDAKIESNMLTTQNYSSISVLLSQIFQPWKYIFQDMTVLDNIKLAFYALNTSDKENSSFTLKLNKKGDVIGATQDQIYNIFKDSEMVNEQKSIEIINDTDITGLAGYVGRVVKNVGGNVVSLTTSGESQKTKIVATSDSESLRRISQLLGVKPTINENMSSIADIQITLGQDFGKRVQKAVE